MFAVISIYQLEQMLDRGQRLILIDLRPQCAYQTCHLKGAVNIPYEEPDIMDFEPYRNQPMVLYCEHGGKSMRVARDLARCGLRVASLASGIQYYRGKYLVSG